MAQPLTVSDPDGAVESLIHLLHELETSSQEQCNKLQQQMDKILETKDLVQRKVLISQLQELEKEEKRLCDEISTRRTELVVLRQGLRRQLLSLQEKYLNNEADAEKEKIDELKSLVALTHSSGNKTPPSSERPKDMGEKKASKKVLGDLSLEDLHGTPTIVDGKIVELSNWEIDPQELVISNQRLGCGIYGEVWKGKYQQSTVAIKKLFVQSLDSKTLTQFCREVKIMSSLRHPNILMLLGACTKPGKFYMVTEFMANGSVADLIHSSDNTLSFIRKMMIAKGVAQGMNWLHNMKPEPILHLDLKPANLLLDDNCNVRIADFGISRLGVEAAQSGHAGSPIYMSPEMPLDTKSDVFSFGITLNEMYSGTVPYSNQYKDFATLKLAVIRGARPDIPSSTPKRLRELITACVHPDPARRPTFKDMLQNEVFGKIVIEGVISEHHSAVREMWTKEFFGKWSDFCKAFSKHMKVDMEDQKDVKIECLKRIISTSPDPKSEPCVTIETFGNAMEWFGPIADGNDLLRKVYQLVSNPWFFGYISKEQAEQHLFKKFSPGTFLVRFSTTNPGWYTISTVTRNKHIAHYKIEHSPGKGYTIASKEFPTLQDVIKTACGSGIKNISLKKPVEGSEFVPLLLMEKEMKKDKHNGDEGLYFDF